MTRDRAPADLDDRPPFSEPWQARAFGIAVALVGGEDDADGDYAAFQARLAEAVADVDVDADDPDEVYYRQWLTALERLLADRALLDPDEAAERAAEFAAGDRDAAEFVDGDR